MFDDNSLIRCSVVENERGRILAKKKLKNRLIPLLVLLSLTSTGCVSIRTVPQRTVPAVANCGLSNVAASERGCELYDRSAIVKKWARQLNPIKLVPTGVSDWVSQQPERCSAMKASVQGWVHKKKEEANPPPWPRFHPVPTHPVFESDEAEYSEMPAIYGRFGKG